jgi:hypothetical protein
MKQMTFRIGPKALRLTFSDRAWKLLGGPCFESGKNFVRCCGVYDRNNFSVARGLRKGAFAIRSRHEMLHLSELLLREIEADADLFAYDYRGEIRERVGNSVPTLGGLPAHVWNSPPGFCYLNVYGRRPDGKGRVVEWVDLRPSRRFSLDGGVEIVVSKRKQKLEWPTLLRRLTRFLRSNDASEVRIEFKE